MKYLSYLLFVLVIGCKTSKNNTLTASNSKIVGKFCTPSNLSGSCFEFKEDQTFKYSSWGCLGAGSLGIGNFKLARNNILEINFEDNFDYSDKSVIKVDTLELFDYEFDLNITMKDLESGEEIIGGTIIYGSEMPSKQGLVTDLEGNAKLKLKENIDKLVLQFHYTGYKSSQVNLGLNAGSYNIEVFMDAETEFIQKISAQTNRYKLIKVNNKKLIMKTEKGKRFTLYRFKNKKTVPNRRR